MYAIRSYYAFDAGSTSSLIVIGTMTISATASGTTRMRVSMKYNAIPASCGAFTYGQVEDYTVNITSSGRETEENVFTAAEITLYPNPTNGILNINGLNNSSAFTIYNLLGQTVKKGKIENNTINVETLEQGHYIIEIQSNDQIVTKRFIKK